MFDMSGGRQTTKPTVDGPLDGGVRRVGVHHLGARAGPTTASPFSHRPANMTAAANLRFAPGMQRSRLPHFTAPLEPTALARLRRWRGASGRTARLGTSPEGLAGRV